MSNDALGGNLLNMVFGPGVSFRNRFAGSISKTNKENQKIREGKGRLYLSCMAVCTCTLHQARHGHSSPLTDEYGRKVHHNIRYIWYSSHTSLTFSPVSAWRPSPYQKPFELPLRPEIFFGSSSMYSVRYGKLDIHNVNSK